ncbi:MAG: large conductance mechanosensitive channel protein MscL [Eubacteriales bacterium]|nr:large conductance mechanosensitive channel protein MscL [Eubacteriales bacterium]
MKKFIEEFKEFAIKGNMIDMAVGIIIGGTFSTIVKSLVDNIFMPLISLLTGKVDFSNMFIALDGNKYATLADAEEVGAALIKYGQFITDIINFILLLLIVFIFVKQVNMFRAAQEAKKPKEEEEITEKECPYCFTKISVKAKRCPCCTSELPEE